MTGLISSNGLINPVYKHLQHMACCRFFPKLTLRPRGKRDREGIEKNPQNKAAPVSRSQFDITGGTDVTGNAESLGVDLTSCRRQHPCLRGQGLFPGHHL